MTYIRPGWDEYGLILASAVATRADCTRRRVGCVVLDKDNRVASTGYNASYPGGPSCLAGQCPRGQSTVAPGSQYEHGSGTCVATHAEANALLYADYSRLRGGTAYITTEPCDGCRKLLQAVPLSRVVWPEGEIVYG